jgi:macrocin-O-methyltransferase TylF-like protien
LLVTRCVDPGYEITLMFGFLKKTNLEPGASAADPTSLAEIRLLIQESKFGEALRRLSHIKAQHQPSRDVDYLRALCFLNEQRPIDAIEALREELRFFADNQPAAQLLEKLAAKHHAPCSIKDREFREIFNIVRPYTMLGEARLYSLFSLAKYVCTQEVRGNFVECGVAAGGSSALLAAVMGRYSQQPRRLFCFDTFEGMPAASVLDISHGKPADATGWGAGTCAAPEASLRKACQKLGVEKRVEPIKGLFADTLPVNRERIGSIALLHMDGDWYSSTRDILENLFDQVVTGGRIQIDDYGYWEGCKRAVCEFEKVRSLKFEITQIDETGIWLPR